MPGFATTVVAKYCGLVRYSKSHQRYQIVQIPKNVGCFILPFTWQAFMGLNPIRLFQSTYRRSNIDCGGSAFPQKTLSAFRNLLAHECFLLTMPLRFCLALCPCTD